MTGLWFIVFVNILAMVSTIPDKAVRIYDSFAEIRQTYKGPLRFRQSYWDSIKHESIVLQSLSEANTSNVFSARRIVRINDNVPGRTVFVRRSPEQKHFIRCELIKDNDEFVVVREMETGHYLRIPSNLVEYSHEPQLSSIYEVSFHPIKPNHSFVISYITNTLRWQTRYTLQVSSDGQTKFQILADIINSGPLSYDFNVTKLMAGDINLTFGKSSKSSSLIATTTSSNNIIDYNGIHLFSVINNSLTLEPYSIRTLPILLPSITVKIIFTYNLVLSIPLSITNPTPSIISGKHKFLRLYQLCNSSSLLPTGHLLVYDSQSNILTGEYNLPTLAESEKYEFELGQDADIMIVYNRTLTMNSATNSSLVTTNVLIQNYKQRKVNIRFKSMCQLSMSCVFYDNKSRSLGSRLRYDLILETKSEVTFTFTTVRIS